MKMKKYSKYHFSALLFTLAAAFASVSCADEDIAKDQTNDDKNGVSFTVTDVQDALDADLPTRAADTETFLTRSIDFNEAGTSDMCLQESTIPGVNPMKRTPQTRAWLKNTIDGNFGTLACKNGSTTPDFFYNKEVNKHGKMLQPVMWLPSASTLKFYAVYPYMNGTNASQKLVQATTGSLPYVAFEASTDILNQTDLMTAKTDPINYTATGGSPHVVPLKFYHALTAIRFGIGSNLSWNKTIKSIEFQGIYKSGHFDLVTKTWSNQSDQQNFKLDDINKSTVGTPNTVIVKDGNTFLMVPQTLPSGAKIVITFTDGTHVTANIGGKVWAPRTTKTYMITERNSNWDYTIEATDPSTIAYNETQSMTPYTVKSYRKDKGSGANFQPVKWKVVGYDADNDGTFDMNEKPTWLDKLSLTEGNGGTVAESGIVTVKNGATDLLAARNNALKTAGAKGNATTPYDLSTKGGSVARSTANSYVISAPGHYSIPLVYGNAITNGNNNTHAYISQAQNIMPNENFVLRTFKDHNNQNITDPWITLSNGGANVPDGAKLVWADESGLVTNPTVIGSGNNAFVKFEVPASAIKNGNAVIAVTKAGVVVWSWHLWFAPQGVLNTTEVTNFQNKKYKFSHETLGWKYTSWSGSEYTVPRTVKVKVQQTEKNGANYKEAVFTITQNPGNTRSGYATFYQFGRKDAFPGTDTQLEGTFTMNGGNNMSIQNGIQHPETFYTNGGSWNSRPPYGYSYCNLWSMDNIVTGFNDNTVVKTIYDPCPAGFKMPAPNAFTGFTKDGANNGAMNVNGVWDNGWNFNNKITNPDATVYFPVSGLRGQGDGELSEVNMHGWYWTAGPSETGNSLHLSFVRGGVSPQNSYPRASGFSVHPVAE